jgi:AcrR family transcriptional regulator
VEEKTTIERRRSPRGEGERLRKEILAATQALLLETGDEDAVSIRAIAARVGVTPPSIYLHFADKDELIGAVCESVFADLGAQVEAEVAGIEDPLEALRQRGRAYVAYGVAHPEPYRVVFMTRHDHTREEFENAALPGMETFQSLVANVVACIEAGAIAPGDPFAVAIAMWAVVHGLTSLRIGSTQGMIDDDLTGYVIDTAIRGLAPERP